MAIRPPDDRVLDDSRILAQPDFRTDRVLAGPPSRAQAILASPAVGQSAIPSAPLVGSHSVGDIVWRGEIAIPGRLPTTPFAVRLARERKHPTGRAFEQLRHAQAEADASYYVCAIHRSGPAGRRGYRVFETDTHRDFVSPTVFVATTKRWPPDFVEMRNVVAPRQNLVAAFDDMAAHRHAERGQRMRRILEEHLGIDPKEIGIVRELGDGYQYSPGRLNVDGVETLLDAAGLTIYVDGRGSQVKAEIPWHVPQSTVILGRNAFDPRTRLVTWAVIIHEETHLRMRADLVKVAAKWRADGAVRPFPDWLAAAHAAGLEISGVRIDDNAWLMLREMIGDLTYAENPSTIPLGECRASFNAFANVFHNFDLTALRSIGLSYDDEVFGEITYCAKHWGAAQSWNNAIPGFSQRFLSEWRGYARALPAFHRGALMDYAMANSSTLTFFEGLLAGP